VSETEKRPLLVLLKDLNGNYVVADQSQGETPRVGVDALDDGPGIRLKASNNVLLGKNQFSGTSEYAPYYDTDDMLVTAAFYSDTKLAVLAPGNGSGGTKRLYVPGLHVWITPNPNTKIDAKATALAASQRDDRPLLYRVARMAAAWYGRKRTTVALTRTRIYPETLVGKLIASVYSGGAYTPVGTVATGETFAWDDEGNESSTLQTDFRNIDLTRVTRRKVAGGEREVNRRIARLEERLEATPLRPLTAVPAGALPVLMRTVTNQYTLSGVQVIDAAPILADGTISGATQTLRVVE
jgi:hypothetical protein